jgi:hypothetical protein
LSDPERAELQDIQRSDRADMSSFGW